jgi:hypothetical protein
MLMAALLAALLIMTVALPWIVVPTFRTFSWHALLHSDIVYRLTDPGVFPEETELVGLHTAYAWAGHTFWAVLGTVADIPPTLLYPISNIIWLLVSAYLLYEIGVACIGVRQSSALFGVGLALLGTHSVMYAIRLGVNDAAYGVTYFGYRLSTILQKYRGFETMPFAFALFIALMLVVIWRLRTPLGAPGAIEASLLISLGLIYPIVFPVGLVLVGSQVLLMLVRWARDVRPFGRREISFLILGMAVAIIAFAATYIMYTRDTHGPLPLSFAGRQTKLWQSFFALLPFLILALPAAIRGVRAREGVVTLLVWTSACSTLLFIIASLSELEYKSILTASLLLAPVCVLTMDRLFSHAPRWQWWVAIGVPVLLMGLELLYVFRMGKFIPANLMIYAPSIHEDHFQIRLDPSEPDAGWVQAVREETSEDTVLVATESLVHLGPFVRRTLYAPSDVAGQNAVGYSMPNREHLVSQRRYSEEDYDSRAATVAEFYTADRDSSRQEALATMLAFGRPLAIHFVDSEAPALRWLRKQHIGRSVYTDGHNVVWLVEPPAAGS